MKILLIVGLILAATLVSSASAMPNEATMPTMYLPSTPYHPVGWDHDSLVYPPGWLNVYDENIRYDYFGDVVVTTKYQTVKGSFYAYRAGAPWFICGNNGQIFYSGGPNANWPVDMQFTYYRWN